MAFLHVKAFDVFAVCLVISVVCYYAKGLQKLPKIVGEQYSFVRPEGDTVVFSCEKQLAEVLKQHDKRRVNATVTWKHNGRVIRHKKRRYVAAKALLYFYHLKPKDTGLVLCEIDVKTKIIGRIKTTKTLLGGVYSVCVIPSKPIARLTPRAVTILTTNLAFFPHVDTPLHFYWYKDEEQIMKTSGLVAGLPTKLSILEPRQSYAGIWRCIVESRALKMIWTTSCSKVDVEKKKELLPLLIDLFSKTTSMPEFQLISRWTMLVIFVHILALVRLYARADYP